MGWWSTDIMGGDSPLDWEDAFYRICEVQKFTKDFSNILDLPKEAIESNWDKLIQEIDGYDSEIGWQVLAVKAMAVGVNIPDHVMEKMIWACDEDCWAKEDLERAQNVSGLKAALQVYDGTPIRIKSKGLFEVIADKISENKKQ